MVNLGSVVAELPGVQTNQAAGSGNAWGFLCFGTAYVGVFPWFAIVACAGMRAVHRRHPNYGPLRMIALCYALNLAVQVVFEGLLMMPLGLYALPGGHFPIFNVGTYAQYPINEALFGGAVFASFTALRYFLNDRGETIAERGSSTIASRNTRIGLRALAIIGAVHVGFLLTYHLPSAVLGLSSPAWPRDTQERSYFNNHVCGPEVDRACPGPETRLTGRGDPHLNYRGQIVGAPPPG
jgi:hypothetical protein